MKERFAQKRKALSASLVALVATAVYVVTGVPEEILLPVLVLVEGLIVHEVPNDPPATVVPPHDNLA